MGTGVARHAQDLSRRGWPIGREQEGWPDGRRMGAGGVARWAQDESRRRWPDGRRTGAGWGGPTDAGREQEGVT